MGFLFTDTDARVSHGKKVCVCVCVCVCVFRWAVTRCVWARQTECVWASGWCNCQREDRKLSGKMFNSAAPVQKKCDCHFFMKDKHTDEVIYLIHCFFVFFFLQLQRGIVTPEERYDNISPCVPCAPLPEASLTSSHVLLSSGHRRRADKNTSTRYIITWIWISRGDPSDCKGAPPVDPINFKLRALIYLQMAALLQGGW